MAYSVKKVDVWAADMVNRPGMLARALEALTEAGADMEFLVGRRATEKTSRVFIAPIKGKKQKDAAKEVGFVPAVGMNALRVEGPDRRGLGSAMSRAIAAADVNIRGVTAARMGRKAIFYYAFKTPDETKSAAAALRKALAKFAR